MRFAARFVAGLLGLLQLTALADAETITIASTAPHKGGHVALAAELIRPEGAGPWPAIVFMHGCAGLDDEAKQSLEAHARYFADEGFVGLILDSFGPREVAGVCEDDDGAAAARDFRLRDAFDARARLAKLPFVDGDNIFLVGQSHGASVALRAAVSEYVGKIKGASRFNAVAALYPWCGEFVARPVDYVSPVLLFTADQDTWAPYTLCTDLPVLSGDAEVRLVLYQNARHGFDIERPERTISGHSLAYNAVATTDSRKRSLALFRRYLVGLSAQLVPSRVLALQARLAAMGFDPGPVDGVWSESTLTALNALRVAHGLRPVKRLDEETISLLGSSQ
jgi:dienelactone hydrolase